ncbi:MAG: nucleotidyl transferase AbiEii/AbiGii toxin family protein [Ignavibacteriae bacterium]|nr:nucleotidyl transferase AbiEii/AbiGii toxin family protein [Ignavibacteriota bacterium]
MDLREDKTCYETPEQRAVLVELLALQSIRSHFFLTGGTALSVFYLHHRLSNDIDLFSRDLEALHEVDYELRLHFGMRAVRLRGSEYILTYRIDETKVDIVRDPLSLDEARPTAVMDRGREIRIDTLRNICSNKLTAMASRAEPKDFVDLFFLGRDAATFDLAAVYADAVRKDAIFDDPATAAYAIESNLGAVQQATILWPATKEPFVYDELLEWYARMLTSLYGFQDLG